MQCMPPSSDSSGKSFLRLILPGRSLTIEAKWGVSDNRMRYVLRSHIERFSSECRKTKTKLITLASHNGHRRSSKSIKTQTKRGKRVWENHNWFRFYFSLDTKSGTDFLSQSHCVVFNAKAISFRRSNKNCPISHALFVSIIATLTTIIFTPPCNIF